MTFYDSSELFAAELGVLSLALRTLPLSCHLQKHGIVMRIDVERLEPTLERSESGVTGRITDRSLNRVNNLHFCKKHLLESLLFRFRLGLNSGLLQVPLSVAAVFLSSFIEGLSRRRHFSSFILWCGASGVVLLRLVLLPLTCVAKVQCSTNRLK